MHTTFWPRFNVQPYNVDLSTEPVTTATVDVKSEINLDGVSRISGDPLWGIMCMTVGFPIIIFNIIELHKEPRS